MIRIIPVGGYNEFGRNMTLVLYSDGRNEEGVLFDMGIHLENYIKLTEDEDIIKLSYKQLINADAVPDISRIKGFKDRIKAIVPTHAHLDHIGGIPFLSNKFNAPILCSPFTAAVLRRILKDEKITLKNSIMSLSTNATFKLSEKLTVEFINITHSTPDTVVAVLHTPDGAVVYANDFKIDTSPVIGKRSNIARLKELKGVKAIIIDSTGADKEMKTPSEAVAREMLKDVLFGVSSEGSTIIVTTFSSHIARLKSIIQIGKQLKRRIVLLGRSLSKYVGAAEDAGIVKFSKDAKIFKYARQIKRELKRITREGKEKYLIIATGHQGEPKSTLSKMVRGEFDFKFTPGDVVVFSCRVIPTEINRQNRKELEDSLKRLNARIFRDVHVSGHASAEDLKEMLFLVGAEHVIPSHGELSKRKALAGLAQEAGYKKDKIHLLSNFEELRI